MEAFEHPETRENVFSGFYEKSVEERIALIQDRCQLTEEETRVLKDGVSIEQADSMIENVIGKQELPLGVAPNFIINDKEFIVPMVVEEASIVAGASKTAKIVRQYGGFEASADPSLLMGHIQLMPQGLSLEKIRENILNAQESLKKEGNDLIPNLINRGGGITEINVSLFKESRVGPMATVEILVNTGDAMGANIVSKICEGLADKISKLGHARANLKILSNLSDRRMARASCRIPITSKDMPENIATRIIEAQALAEIDPYRAATHNKGIFNGIDAVAVATGQDWRAIEAGAHAYAARSGKYQPLSNWDIENGFLVGSIELPMAVGTVGGVVESHPVVKTALKILGVKNARELAQVMATTGLAQNFAALNSLVTEGIQQGHVPLHRRKKE